MKLKWCAILLASAALCVADAPRKFLGVVHDNRCVGPACATQCPVRKSPTYTLQSGDEAWVLTDQKSPAQFTGKKVVVTGTLGADNKLKVLSIVPVK